MLPRGDRSGGGDRFLDVRVGLFWLGALVWLTGVVLDLPLLTGGAIVILLVALALGLIARRVEPDGPAAGENEEGRHP
jgi:hypothetical protein